MRADTCFAHCQQRKMYGVTHMRDRAYAVLDEGWFDIPSMINQSGFCTRSESGCGSRSDSHLVSSASLISESVR
jgi:hypothetical protein